MNKLLKKFGAIFSLALILTLLCCFTANAWFVFPEDANDVPATSLSYVGAEFTYITSTTTLTSVFTGNAVLLDVWAICYSTSTTGSVYLTKTSTGTAAITDAWDTAIFIPTVSTGVAYGVGARTRRVDPFGRTPIRMTGGLKAQIVEAEAQMDLLFLYFKE